MVMEMCVNIFVVAIRLRRPDGYERVLQSRLLLLSYLGSSYLYRVCYCTVE